MCSFVMAGLTLIMQCYFDHTKDISIVKDDRIIVTVCTPKVMADRRPSLLFEKTLPNGAKAKVYASTCRPV
jgi:hypothetical protein